MDAITKLIFAACALLLSGGLGAQTFKCVDALGKITYSGKKCSELGLKDAGEVKDRLNINPAPPSQPSTTRDERRRTPSAPAQAPAAQATEAQPTAPAEPAAPERRCFTVKTAKGNVTRCNDAPD
jgi:uncharacterized protein DUF4124